MNEKKTVYTDVRILDGLGGEIENGWLFIEKDRIADCGQGDPDPQQMMVWEKSGVHIIQAAGSTILPGLIDTHVHLSLSGSPDPMTDIVRSAEPTVVLHTARNADKTLRAGVTSVRDLGSLAFIDTHVRDAIESGLIPGPRMKCAGQMICTTGGHGCSIGYQADGPVEIIKGVRTQIRSGVDVIKFMATSGVLTRGSKPGMPQLNPDELRAGIEEAHKASLKTAAHVQGIEGAWNAVRAGIDSIEHGVSLDDDIIQEMIDKNVFLVPTFSAPYRILERGIQAKIPQEYVEKTRRIQEAHVTSVNRARQAGVKIAMGTDAGTPFNLHGENVMELCYMVENGFSETEAIVSATSRAAELLGSDTEEGRIVPGMKADLLVVEGNPLESIKILGDPARITVYKNGRQVPDRNHSNESN